MASPASGGQTNLGVAPNVGGLLCYIPCCIGFLFSVVVAVVEKQSRFVRFHAFQSLLLHAVAFVVLIGLQVVSLAATIMHVGFLSLLLLPIEMLIGVGILGLSVLLMIKANGGEEFQLPVIGEMAKKWS